MNGLNLVESITWPNLKFHSVELIDLLILMEPANPTIIPSLDQDFNMILSLDGD